MSVSNVYLVRCVMQRQCNQEQFKIEYLNEAVRKLKFGCSKLRTETKYKDKARKKETNIPKNGSVKNRRLAQNSGFKI